MEDQTAMPHVVACESIVWAESKAEGSRMLVLLAIARYCDPTGGGAFMHISTIARMVRSSERNARYHIAALEELGELVCYGVHESGNSIYAINLPSLAHRVRLHRTFAGRKRSKADRGPQYDDTRPANDDTPHRHGREPWFREEESSTNAGAKMGNHGSARKPVSPPSGKDLAETQTEGASGVGTNVPTTPYIDRVNSDLVVGDPSGVSHGPDAAAIYIRSAAINDPHPGSVSSGDMNDPQSATEGFDLVGSPIGLDDGLTPPKRLSGGRRRNRAGADVDALRGGKRAISPELLGLLSGPVVEAPSILDNGVVNIAAVVPADDDPTSSASPKTAKGRSAARRPGSTADLALVTGGGPADERTGRPMGKFMDADQAEFDEFWQSYPAKIGKKDALVWWKKNIAMVRAKYVQILAGLEAYKASNPDIAAGHVPPCRHPTTWLNGEHWEDEYAPQESGMFDAAKYRRSAPEPEAPTAPIVVATPSAEQHRESEIRQYATEFGISMDDQPRYYSMVRSLGMSAPLRHTLFAPPEGTQPPAIVFTNTEQYVIYVATVTAGLRRRLTDAIGKEYRAIEPTPRAFTVASLRELLAGDHANQDSAKFGD